MPYPTQTGLTQLGEALSSAAVDYRDEKRKTDRESELRAQRLADVQSERAYEQSSFANRLQLSGQQDAALALIHEGLLSPTDLGNPQAIAAAYEVARQRGLDKLYSDLLTTPGPTGKPLLDRSQLNDPKAIEAAKSALGQIRATATKLQMEQPVNAQAAINSLNQEAQQVRGELARVEAKLAEGAPTIDNQTILNRALALAKEAKGGKAPSQQEIQSMVGQATAELQQQALQRWFQDKEDAKIQSQTLTARLNSIRAQQSDLTKTFQVAPGASSLQEPVVTPGRPPALEASPEQRSAAITAAVRAAIGPPAPAPAAASPGAPVMAAPLPNPTNEPMIEQENQRIQQSNLGRQNSSLADPYNAALDQMNAVKSEIAAVRGGAPLVMNGPDDLGRPVTITDPSLQARRLSDLLIKQQQVQRDLEAKRRLMLGLPAGDMTPVMSNAASSVPADYSKPDNWWQGR